ncbi:MAG TPA: hypothetical protein DDW49_10375 [Deltaproteobacteria bacterium]|nr:MAG: hypothetical protein A2048_08040 [Deltaproteobacteria bacterium GWA2_45_12]HBF13768.1 hypothetical protein [Deltaproteobacteria bacterium]
MQRKFIFILSVFLTLSCSAIADVLFMDLSHLADKADYICHVKVHTVTSRYEVYDSQLEMVMSHVRLEILENIKGKLPTNVEIRSFGGEINGRQYTPEDFPEFHNGEELVLFLKNFQGGVFTVGHFNGKKEIINGKIKGTNFSVSEFTAYIRSH